MVDSQLQPDRSSDPFEYPLRQRLKKIRALLASSGFAREWDHKLALSLVLLLHPDADEEDRNRTKRGNLLPGPLADRYETSRRFQNNGRARWAACGFGRNDGRHRGG